MVDGMDITRFKRGAVHSLHSVGRLGQHKLSQVSKRVARVDRTSARNFVLNLLVLRTVLLPVPISVAHAAGGEELVEPPSMVRLSSQAAEALDFQLEASTLDSSLSIEDKTFQSITIGKSLAKQQAEESARQQEALAEQQRRETAARLAAEAAAKAKQAAQLRVIAQVPVATGSVQEIAHQMTVAAFGEAHWQSMANLIQRESGFNVFAKNRSSGAYGLGQALPASKMAPFGSDYLTNPVTQMSWMISYVRARYGTPNQAWAFWTAHHWY
jgi:hypothetical protein